MNEKRLFRLDRKLVGFGEEPSSREYPFIAVCARSRPFDDDLFFSDKAPNPTVPGGAGTVLLGSPTIDFKIPIVPPEVSMNREGFLSENGFIRVDTARIGLSGLYILVSLKA